MFYKDKYRTAQNFLFFNKTKWFAYLTLEEMHICQTSWRSIPITFYSDSLLLSFTYSLDDSPICLTYF